MKDRILQIMKQDGMSQSEFSKATGIPAASLSSIFNGRTAPTMKHAEAIHRYCSKLSMAWLLFGEGEMYAEEQNEHTNESSSEGGQPADELQNVRAREGYTTDGRADLSNSMLGIIGGKNGYVSGAETSVFPYKQPRKIVEIRIFFDDGTFETFKGNA